MADIESLANKAAERLKASSDKSDLRFFNITKEVVKGTGIRNPSDLARVTREVRDELRRRSAKHRTAEAAKRRVS